MRWARHNPGIAVLGGVLTAVLLLATLASLVVAGHMSSLADQETQAADDERTARDRRRQSPRTRKPRNAGQAEAGEERRRREPQACRRGVAKAEENFAKARAAVNDYLTAVSEDERLKAPGLQGLRSPAPAVGACSFTRSS